MQSLSRRPLASSLSLLFVAGAAFGSPVLYAQDTTSQATSPPDKATTLSAVVVTGSRIKSADIATQVPVMAISSEQIKTSGLTSIGDIMQQLSSAGSGLNTKFNSTGNFGQPPSGGGIGAGASTLDLRNLGPNRVLVLVDGKRWVNESSGSGVSGSVDMNTIPASIIDRIEVLQDGASALYGSDAIAGVVNIITKNSQDGANATYYIGTYNNLRSTGTTTHGSLSYGKKTDNNEFFVDFDYFNQQPISSNDWSVSRECIPGTGLANCSAATPRGRYTFIDPSGVRRDVTLNEDFTGSYSHYPDDYHKFTNDDRFNYAVDNKLLTPNLRNAIFASDRYQLTPEITWYVRGLYNNRRSNNSIAPTNFTISSGAYGLSGSTTYDVTNPYNPFGFTLDPATNLISMGGRKQEAGMRIATQNVHTTYFATGLEGSFGFMNQDFYWDVNFNTGDNNAYQRRTGNYDMAHLKVALGPLSVCQATPGCVPFNLTGGPGAVTPEMNQWVLVEMHDQSENKSNQFSANLSGDVVDLPAGPLGVALGGEHRYYTGNYYPDVLSQNGDSGGRPVPPTTGSYSINEYYLELNAPLVHDVPGFKALDLSAATRYSDYSTFGSTVNSKFGLRWQIFNDLTLRGTWAEGFRAPSIGESFGSLVGFTNTIQDYCSADRITAELKPKCAAMGVPVDYVQFLPWISVRTGGNPNLKPETSTSLTLGAVYSPSWITDLGWASRFDVSLNYYHIMLNGAIQAVDAQTKLNDCNESGDMSSEACSGMQRSSTGEFVLFDNQLENLGNINTAGFDFSTNWASPVTSVGTFTANLSATYANYYRSTDAEGQLQPRIVSIETANSVISRLKSNLRLGWSYKSWLVNTTLRFISAANENCASAAKFPICDTSIKTPERPQGTHRLASTTYQDLRVSWKVPVSLDLTLTAGVNNLWDKWPPICVSCTLNGYDASTYDLPSRFAYVQASLNF